MSLILLLAVAGMLLAGLGFYWLEPTATSYLDGLWLAFVTGSTVGYGDIVPTSHAARLLAVFTVLSGFTFLSVVTAYFAALLIGEDEKKLQRELHHNMRTLHAEIAALRQEIQRLPTAAAAPPSSTIKADQPKTD
ncbi:two pore domain potassium channel family protein [Parvibium lacunae]|uniref:Two pore domain potassium channel family protein n=1 Tax=Parvibium lacunae TaxID=1888893 RepID=A0A368L551_9BURK|nr:two pore domain potassium channel family protein [Parvibium lacunae]